MKHSLSDVNNGCDIEALKIVFDNIPHFDDQDTVISDLIHWQPLYDLYVVNDEVVVTIEIAGVKIKDFSIYVEKKVMIIDGIRKSPHIFTSECLTFHNIEILYGRFYRRIDFPILVEPKQYQYKINNGILTLRFPTMKERIIPIEDG